MINLLPGARLRVVPGYLDDPYQNRIHFHITSSGNQMALLQRTGTKSSLKKIAPHAPEKLFMQGHLTAPPILAFGAELFMLRRPPRTKVSR